MPHDELPWRRDWQMRLAAWIERGGTKAVGSEELALLRAIERSRSISEAARQLGRSYRWTWLAVQAMNEAAGTPLVLSTAGGKRGGGAALTPSGREAAALLEGVQSELETAAAVLMRRRVQRHGADTPVVHLAAAISLRDAIGQILNDYALRRPDVAVRTLFGSSRELADQLLSHALGDVFVSADGRQIERLEEAGRLLSGARRVVARNSLALAVPADSELSVRSPRGLASGSAPLALAGPDCPLGRYTRDCLATMGLDETLYPRAVLSGDSSGVLAALRAGQAQACIAFASDAVAAPDIRVLWRSPANNPRIEYHAAIIATSNRQELAADLLSHLCSREAARRFRNCGFGRSASGKAR